MKSTKVKTVVFISNYFNHHQRFLSDELYKLTEGNYYFIETAKISQMRLNMGYGETELPEYVKQYYLNHNECQSLIDNADIVIFGLAPNALIRKRQKDNKYVFRYGERIYKGKYKWYKWPFRLFTFYKNYGRYKKTYMLCASGFTAADYAKHFTFLNKTYKWGYFPETKKYSDINELLVKKEKASILWVGRFLNWKHPDTVLRIAKRLKENGYYFSLSIIGAGEMEKKLKELICEYALGDCVKMLGSMKPQQVREYMERSQIYLFTSDKKEGWGAVLNESMNSGCAVVASNAIGAVPFLIEDGENGLIYKDGDEDDLYNKVVRLLQDVDLCKKYGGNAYVTLTEKWSAKNAAERFLKLVENILSGNKKPDLYKKGPCSKAEILKDNWYKK